MENPVDPSVMQRAAFERQLETLESAKASPVWEGLGFAAGVALLFVLFKVNEN